jgi:hypothetical protein
MRSLKVPPPPLNDDDEDDDGTRLTPELHAVIVDHIEKGGRRGVAARKAGISLATFKRWMMWGKASPKSKYGKLRKACEKAAASVEHRMIMMILRASPKDWKAAQAYLRMVKPGDYSERTRTEVTGKGGKDLAVGPVIRPQMFVPKRKARE